MPRSPASLEVRIVDDKTSVIAITGEFSALAEAAVMEAYLQACSAIGAAALNDGPTFPTTIVFDFDQVVSMNSGGIGLLITLLIRMKRQRQRMYAFGLSEHDQHLFALTHLDEAIPIFDTEAAALAAAQRHPDE